MKYLNCHGAIYRVSDAKYREILRRLSRFEMTYLGDFGELWGEPVVGEIIDIGNMTREQAATLIWELPRTKSEVILSRQNAVGGGCCNLFADQQGCDCLSTAIED